VQVEPGAGKNSPSIRTKTLALFDEAIDMAHGIPQGYSIDELEHEGIMFEAARCRSRSWRERAWWVRAS